jgi:hypothetical protein
MSMQAPGVQDKGDKEAVDAKTVNKFHNKSDVDSASTAQHHTLGPRADQAASGKHNHDGRNSPKILEGTTLTGSRSGGSALDSVISALVQLGATDSTSA